MLRIAVAALASVVLASPLVAASAHAQVDPMALAPPQNAQALDDARAKEKNGRALKITGGVLLGGGRRMFDVLPHRVELEQGDVGQDPGVAHVSYRVVR